MDNFKITASLPGMRRKVSLIACPENWHFLENYKHCSLNRTSHILVIEQNRRSLLGIQLFCLEMMTKSHQVLIHIVEGSSLRQFELLADE